LAKAASLSKLVDRHAATELLRRGFVYEASGQPPTFRRHRTLPDARVVQLIEFQAGVKKGSFGTFTVNLGVYSPEWTRPPRNVAPEAAHSWDCMAEMWMRLGHLAPAPKPGLLRRAFGASSVPSDRWWSYRGSSAEVERTLTEVLGLLIGSGQAWLDHTSTREAFETAQQVLEARVERLKGQGS
jgi:hypothetical protein